MSNRRWAIGIRQLAICNGQLEKGNLQLVIWQNGVSGLSRHSGGSWQCSVELVWFGRVLYGLVGMVV